MKNKENEKAGLKIKLELELKQQKAKFEMFELECEMDKKKRIGEVKRVFQKKILNIQSVLDQYSTNKGSKGGDDSMFAILEA